MSTETAPGAAREPVHRDPDASQQRILAAATEVFAAQGLDGARVDDIAERAGINKRMLYHYFGNKDELFGAVLDDVYETICRDSAALDLATGTPPAALTRLVDFAVDFYLDNRHAITLLNAENLHRARHLKNSSRVRAIHRPFEEMIDNLLDRGVANGDFRRGMNGPQIYMSIVGLIYYYLSNGHSLSVFFDRDLYEPEAIRTWRRHIHEVIDRFVAADNE